MPRYAWTVILGLALAGATAPAAAADLLVRVEGANGTVLEDAVVYAVPVSSPPPVQHVQYTIDQVNRQFVPRINVIQTGTLVSFPNSDNIRHSVYSLSPARVFNLKLYAGRSAEPVNFDKPGLVVLGCNIHDIMVSYVMVVTTPYFARTDRTGTATLSRLPAGTYTLRGWHTPMSEDQQVSEPLHVGAGTDSLRYTLHLPAAAGTPATPSSH